MRHWMKTYMLLLYYAYYNCLSHVLVDSLGYYVDMKVTVRCPLMSTSKNVFPSYTAQSSLVH